MSKTAFSNMYEILADFWGQYHGIESLDNEWKWLIEDEAATFGLAYSLSYGWAVINWESDLGELGANLIEELFDRLCAYLDLSTDTSWDSLSQMIEESNKKVSTNVDKG
jgi:hypothetical protein